MTRIIIVLAVILAALPVHAANVCDPVTGTNCAGVDAGGNLSISEGKSRKATYIVTSSGLATTATFNLSIEAGASNAFRLARFCVGLSNATAAAAVTIAVNRRTTASSGGTLLANDATGADSVSRMDQGDGTFPGVARRTATLGTIGATLFQVGQQVGELGAGTADSAGPPPFCYDFGLHGGKMPIIPAGATNGVSITVTAPGAGGLASGSISAEVIVD